MQMCCILRTHTLLIALVHCAMAEAPCHLGTHTDHSWPYFLLSGHCTLRTMFQSNSIYCFKSISTTTVLLRTPVFITTSYTTYSEAKDSTRNNSTLANAHSTKMVHTASHKHACQLQNQTSPTKVKYQCTGIQKMLESR